MDFKVGDVVRLYGKKYLHSGKYLNESIIKMLDEEGSDFVKEEIMYTFPHFEVMIVSKIIDGGLLSRTYLKRYELRNKKAEHNTNLYGDLAMTFATEDEKKKFMEEYTANKVANDI